VIGELDVLLSAEAMDGTFGFINLIDARNVEAIDRADADDLPYHSVKRVTQ